MAAHAWRHALVLAGHIQLTETARVAVAIHRTIDHTVLLRSLDLSDHEILDQIHRATAFKPHTVLIATVLIKSRAFSPPIARPQIDRVGTLLPSTVPLHDVVRAGHPANRCRHLR